MNKFALFVHRQSRIKKFFLFLKMMHPTSATRVLNVGATGPNTGLPDQFESLYQFKEKVVGGGISFREVRDYCRAFPQVKSVVFDGCALPFADHSFDIVFSNAVIEHLPGRESQTRFAQEVARVGCGWFVTTPNPWFPIDAHYHLPLIHTLPQDWQRRIVAGIGRVPYPHLYLLNKRQFQGLFPTGKVIGCRISFYPETLISYREP